MPITLINGIILGEEPTSRDKHFIDNHKITRVINCAGREIHNYFEPNILYKTLYWSNCQGNIIIDYQQTIIRTIVDFIDEILETDQSCLILSVTATSRAPLCAMIYLMAKCRWSSATILSYIKALQSNVNPFAPFLKELEKLEAKGIPDDIEPFDEETIALYENTFNNVIALKSATKESFMSRTIKTNKHVSFSTILSTDIVDGANFNALHNFKASKLPSLITVGHSDYQFHFSNKAIKKAQSIGGSGVGTVSVTDAKPNDKDQSPNDSQTKNLFRDRRSTYNLGGRAILKRNSLCTVEDLKNKPEKISGNLADQNHAIEGPKFPPI